MNLGQAFRQAAARFLPPKTEKVILNLQDVARSLELTKPKYQNEPGLGGYAHNVVGMYPGVRNPVGNTRAWHADPKQYIIVNPARAQFADGPDEEPYRLRSSACIIANDYLVSRWTRGFNLVMRTAMKKSRFEPADIFAMHAKYDKNDNMTVKRLYLPVFNGARQLTGLQRIPVNQDTVTRAMEYMALCKDQMEVDGGIYLNPRENLIKAFGSIPTATAKGPAPKP